MIKPDVIIVGPDNLDFPVWRELIRANRDSFDQVIQVLHKANRGISFSEFIKKASPEILTLDLPIWTGCWRETATKMCLKQSKNEHVLFLEQDFLPLTSNFFETVFDNYEKLLKGRGVIGFNYKKEWIKNERLHPAFTLIDRKTLENTTQSYAGNKDLDFFGVFSNELLELETPYLLLEDLNLIEERDWYHWNGLCDNFSRVQSGLKAHYKIDRFKEYVSRCLNSNVVQDQRFIELCNKCMTQV